MLETTISCPGEMYQIDQTSLLRREYGSSNFADDMRNTLAVMTPPGDGLGGFFFAHKRDEGAPMVKIIASPDTRYGVRLSNRVSTIGARGLRLKAAIEAAKEGISVASWIVPGKLKLRRRHGAELLHAQYERQMLALPPRHKV